MTSSPQRLQLLSWGVSPSNLLAGGKKGKEPCGDPDTCVRTILTKTACVDTPKRKSWVRSLGRETAADSNQQHLHQWIFCVNLKRELCPDLSWVSRQLGLVDSCGRLGGPSLCFLMPTTSARGPLVPARPEASCCHTLAWSIFYSSKSHRREKLQRESPCGLGLERPLGVDAAPQVIAVPHSRSSYLYLS